MASEDNVTDGQLSVDRRIEIHRDVVNSVIVLGNNNDVVIYPFENKEKSSLPLLGDNPYRGLAAFQEGDADVYFGRKKEVDDLWHRLRNLYEQSQKNEPVHRLLLILGSSGSGKSSLVRAGLLPEIAKHPLPGHKKIRVLVMKPGETPLQSLALMLARIRTGDSSPVHQIEEFQEVLVKRHERGTNDGLSFIAGILPEQDSPLVVLVDQFEEIYSSKTDNAQRAAFVETLLEAAVTRKVLVSVVITLRSDFLGEMQRYPKLNEIMNSVHKNAFFLSAMTQEEDKLLLAIKNPAEQAGHPLDSSIVGQLVKETKDREGALPLLQFALTRIWEELNDSNSKSSEDILEKIGGVGGALAETAERIYKNLDSKEQKYIAQQVFLGLVQIKDSRYTCHRVEVRKLAKRSEREQVREVLDRFSSFDARLITLFSVNSKEFAEVEEFAEVTHEALFENWDRLEKWLGQERGLIQQRDKIEDAASEWKRQGSKRGYLLQGRQLLDARRFRKQQSEQFPLSKDAEIFIDKSLWQQRFIQLKSVGVLLLPTLVLISYSKEMDIAKYSENWDTKNPEEKREAVLFLTKGCPEMRGLSWILRYLAEWRFGTCRSLAKKDLSSVNLGDIDLRNADLRSAIFSNSSNLDNTDFSGADLTSANLKSTRLSNVKLNKTILTKANLIRANLYRANLRNADLAGAQLNQADLSHVDLTSANLSQADLSQATFFHTTFNETNFSGANLFKATHDNSSLDNAIFCGTSMPDGNLNNQNCSNTK